MYSRRNSRKYAGVLGGLAVTGVFPIPPKGRSMSRFALLKMDGREEGVTRSLEVLAIN
jgi:hypothetical protein